MTQVFLSVEDMRATIPQAPHAVVMLAGYRRPQDGGGGTFYWDADETASEDGGTVFAPGGAEKGRYVRVRENHHVNVKWFGAAGDGMTDDTAAIQAAIDALPATGGEVILPGGHYAISRTLRIGDGDGTTPSRKNGIHLIGAGSGIGHQTVSQTTLVAICPMAVMMTVNGPITDCRLACFSINAKKMVETGIRLTAVYGSHMDRVHVWQQMSVGIELNGGSAHVMFHQVGCANAVEDATSLRIGGEGQEGDPVRDCVFTACRFDTAQRDQGIAVHIRYAEKLSFRRCHMNVYRFETAKGLLLDAVGHDGYPRGNTFCDCSITRGYINEDEAHRIGHQFFIGNGTYDHETIQPHPHIFGITDIGSLLKR